MSEHKNALFGITAGLAMLREAIALHCEEQALSICDQLQATADAAIAAPDESHDELVGALADWLYFAESLDCDFSDMDAPECDPNESLCCEQCKEVGCIQRKVRNARAALAKARG